MEQVLKLYVCGLSTVTDRDALYSCHYFFNEGELVVICDECLLFLFFPFFSSFFPSCFCFKALRKCLTETFIIRNETLYLPT